ncbi:hypothetical protein AMECASPLE_026957 [Ameca splendens]|uniref:Uncharacterized protein n=1 Tax=Ameca splendens TaxID=208324 RepID=A0ABV0XI34_9TELE
MLRKRSQNSLHQFICGDPVIFYEWHYRLTKEKQAGSPTRNRGTGTYEWLTDVEFAHSILEEPQGVKT